jgi:hypothetical protein
MKQLGRISKAAPKPKKAEAAEAQKIATEQGRADSEKPAAVKFSTSPLPEQEGAAPKAQAPL